MSVDGLQAPWIHLQIDAEGIGDPAFQLVQVASPKEFAAAL